MHQSEARQHAPESVVPQAASDVAIWTCSPDGTILAAFGPGWLRAGFDAAAVVGTSLFDLYTAFPTLRQQAEDALSGMVRSGTVEGWGATWRYEFRPMLGGGLVGAACAEVDVEDARQVWEAAGDNGKHGVWSGDRFVLCEGREIVTQIRFRSRRDFDDFRSASVSRLHLLRDCPRRPHLRLL